MICNCYFPVFRVQHGDYATLLTGRYGGSLRYSTISSVGLFHNAKSLFFDLVDGDGVDILHFLLSCVHADFLHSRSCCGLSYNTINFHIFLFC